MKWQKYKNHVLNGFKIIDSYIIVTEKGTKCGRVKLECQRCGAVLEKSAAVDIEHVKCKCMLKSQLKPQPTPLTKYLYHGKEYRLFELEKMTTLSRDQIKNWLQHGINIDEVINGKVKKQCVICGKEFETTNIRAKCCSSVNCKNRQHKGRGKLILDHKCEICGKEFQSYQSNARFCSDKCRKSAARLERRVRFRELKAEGKFDISVTLEKVYEKFNGKCCFCEKPLHFGESPLLDDYPTIDHIKPISKGGAHEWDNVQLLCRHCNDVKGAKYGE